MTRPLTVALAGAPDSPTSQLLVVAAAGGRVERVTNLARADLVLVDDAAPGARARALWLRARGMRTLNASEAMNDGDGSGLDVAVLAAAAARPGAGLDWGPGVSVIVTVLNESAVIDELVGIVTSQMRDDDELVIVDGGSTDDSWRKLERWRLRDARITIHALPDGAELRARVGTNISAGRNLAVRVARRDVLVSTDAGCRPGPGWLDAMRVAFAEQPAPALVASVPGVPADSPLQLAQAAACHPDPADLRRPSLLVRTYGRLFGTVFDPTMPLGLSLAFTRQAWQRAGGFPEDLPTTEDAVFGRAVAQHGTCVATLDAEITRHQHPTLRDTYRMYRGYGEGAARSGNATLRVRDAVRAIAYPAALLALARAPRRAAPFLGAGGAAYMSMPVRRLARRSKLFPAALFIPLAMATKDVAKVDGAIRGTRAGRRARTRAAHESSGPSRVRILAVLPSLHTGGIERHALTVYPALDRERFEVRLLCVKGQGELFDEGRASGLPVESLNAGDSNVAILRTLPRLVGRMRSFRPDVVVTSGFSADVVGRLAAALVGVPAIISWKHNGGHVGRYGPKERAVEAFLRPLTTRYLAVANTQVDYLTSYLRLPHDRITVIHNTVRRPETSPDAAAVQRTRTNLGLGHDDLVLAVVAALRSWKGHATLLRAFARVAAQEDRAHLLVIGDGEERANLGRLACALHIEGRVHFLGDRRDVDDLLCATDVVVLPSHIIETCSYAILEAMSRARPAVATDIGDLPELIEAGVTGQLVRPGDDRALAAALLAILQTPDRGASLGRAAYRRLVEVFPFEATVQRIENEMESAIAAGAGGVLGGRAHR